MDRRTSWSISLITEEKERQLDEKPLLNILLAGMNPFYFHALNVVLHCLVTLVLMYTCDKTVFKDSGLAFVTALFFAAHPIHTEAVTGIVGRADVLACLLFLLAFLSYNRKNGGLHVKMARQPTASLQTPLHFPPSSRENGKHRVAHKGTWNSCHPASPEEQQGNGHSVLRKAPWAVLRYQSHTIASKEIPFLAVQPLMDRRTSWSISLITEEKERQLDEKPLLNILLAGMNPFYFHALNVVLHCLVTLVLMYTCDKTVFKDSGLAFVTALFFAAHPIHTEAVSMRDHFKLQIQSSFMKV
ncbi:Transmembrane and TPR repeat-containing protein 1, partial [Ophiophagus hannah]